MKGDEIWQFGMEKSDGIGKFFWDPLGLCLQCFFMRDGARHRMMSSYAESIVQSIASLFIQSLHW